MWVESEFSFSPFALISVPDRLSPVACPSSPADDCSAPGAREQRATHANTGPNLLRSHLIKRAGELPAGPDSQVGWDFSVATATHCIFPSPKRPGWTQSLLRGQLVQTAGAAFCSARPQCLNYSALATGPSSDVLCTSKRTSKARRVKML